MNSVPWVITIWTHDEDEQQPGKSAGTEGEAPGEDQAEGGGAKGKNGSGEESAERTRKAARIAEHVPPTQAGV